MSDTGIRGASDVPLPPTRLRMGGAHFRKDADFIRSAAQDVRLLRRRAGLTAESRLLDWGCGAGRLAVGVKRVLGHVADYHGVDVQPDLVAWAQDHLADEHTRFTLVDQHNERYNPGGTPSFDIPAEDESVDVLYSYSVFSHMLSEDVAGYASTIARILAPGGRAWMTAFVEDGVQDCVENPTDYDILNWKGPLHCVRFERRHFEDLLWNSGLAVDQYTHGTATDGQSAYVLRRRAA